MVESPVSQNRIISLVSVLLTLMLLPSGAVGQAIWAGLPLEPGTWVEITRVDFQEDQNLTALSTTSYMGVRFVLRPGLQLVGELPFSRARIERSNFDELVFGNPYAGVEWSWTDRLVGELGLRLPLGENPSTNLAAALGLNSDAADRLEAWVENSFAFHVAPSLVLGRREGFLARLRGGPTLLVPVGDAPGEVEFIAAYGGQIGYRWDLVQLIGGVSGRAVLSADAEAFNHVVTSVAFDFGGLRPAATIRIPFGDLEGIDAVYALSLFAEF